MKKILFLFIILFSINCNGQTFKYSKIEEPVEICRESGKTIYKDSNKGFVLTIKCSVGGYYLIELGKSKQEALETFQDFSTIAINKLFAEGFMFGKTIYIYGDKSAGKDIVKFKYPSEPGSASINTETISIFCTQLKECTLE